MVALVVETGAGLSNANAYCSVEYADQYNAAHVHGAPWLSVPDKEAAIATATMVLDQQVEWRGTPASDTQALGFPRVGCHDREGRLVASNKVPEQLRRATAELARLIAADDLTAEAAERGLSELTLGEMTLKFDPMDRRDTLPDSVRAHLRGLGSFREPYGSIKAVRG